MSFLCLCCFLATTLCATAMSLAPTGTTTNNKRRRAEQDEYCVDFCDTLCERVDRRFHSDFGVWRALASDVVCQELHALVQEARDDKENHSPDAVVPSLTSVPISHHGRRVLRDMFDIHKRSSVTTTDINGTTETAVKDELLFCDKSIVMFVGASNAAVRRDVIDSLVLAQLNADKQLEMRNKARAATTGTFASDDAKFWFEQLQTTFQHLCWADTQFDMSEVVLTGTNFSMDQILLQVIDSVTNSDEQNKFRHALTILKSLPQDDDRMQLFARRSTQTDLRSFLVHVVYIDGSGSAFMKTTMMALSTKEAVTNVLWFQWQNRDTKVYKVEHNMVLGANAFDGMRDVVRSKVQQINETFVRQLPF